MEEVPASQGSSSVFSQAEKLLVANQLRSKWNLKVQRDRPFHAIPFVRASYSDENVQSFMGCIPSPQDGRLKGRCALKF